MYISTETPIAFALTMVVCLALFFYCWHVGRFRRRVTTVQVSATPEVHKYTGIEKEVVGTFPIVKTHELKNEIQCPICLIEYRNTEFLRKLPFCGHVFHIQCIASWLQKQVTCPICRIDLRKYNPKPEANRHQIPQTTYCRRSSTPNSVTIEISPVTAGMSVTRPLPLLPSTPLSSPQQTPNTSESRESQTLDASVCGKFDMELQPADNIGLASESPLVQLSNAAGWGAVSLHKSAKFSFRSRPADIVIDVGHASTRESWIPESFSFSTSKPDDDRVSSARGRQSLDEVEHTFRSSKRVRSATMSWEFGQSLDESVPELLTVSPEHCSFEILPIITL